MERSSINTSKHRDYFDLDKEKYLSNDDWDFPEYPMNTESVSDLNSLRKGATPLTASINHQAYNSINWDKLTEEYSLAMKDALMPTSYPFILSIDNVNSAWDLRSYKFLTQSHIPNTANPKLWEHSKLNLNSGLFRVTDNIFQIRGFDLSNMSVVKGKTGWIVIDCLTSEETAKTAISLLHKCFGPIPISAIIITNSDVDHYGGILGVLTNYTLRDVKIYAPQNFNNKVAEKKIDIGIAMIRRDTYMYGDILLKDDKGQLDSGMGKYISAGLSALTSNVIELTQDDENIPIEMMIDGIPVKIHISPNYSSEMNIYFPADRALCISELCTSSVHNIHTFKSSNFPYPMDCANYIHKTIEFFGDELTSLFSVHAWPRCGKQNCIDYLEKQRDIYQYMNDQTLRLLNKGYTPDYIGKSIKFPESLSNEWYNNETYDFLSHNCKIIFQRYLGCYDGNPVNLNKLLPEESAKKYIEYMGGETLVLEKALNDFEAGEYQWVAEISKKLIWANPENKEAKLLCADALEQLGYMAESGTWRNEYLMGAQELRFGTTKFIGNILDINILNSIPLSKVLYLFSIRVNGVEAGNLDFKLNFIIPDRDEVASTEIKHGIFRYLSDELSDDAEVTITLPKNILYKLAITNDRPDNSLITIEGDISKWQLFLWSQDLLNPNFNIMTPINTK